MPNGAVREQYRRTPANPGMPMEHPGKSGTALKQRRQRAKYGYVARVVILLTAITAVGYAAWLAPWARPVRHINVRAVY